MAGGTLLVGAAASVVARFPGLRSWLAFLFGINAGAKGVSIDSLRGIKSIDIALLVLAGVTFIGFWPGPGTHQAAWMIVAIALPFAGIAVLLATRLWGRPGLMGGALVLSSLMLIGDTWASAGYLGIAASAFLLVGDFGTTGRRSPLMATRVAAGYMSLVVGSCGSRLGCSSAAAIPERRVAPTPGQTQDGLIGCLGR